MVAEHNLGDISEIVQHVIKVIGVAKMWTANTSMFTLQYGCIKKNENGRKMSHGISHNHYSSPNQCCYNNAQIISRFYLFYGC